MAMNAIPLRLSIGKRGGKRCTRLCIILLTRKPLVCSRGSILLFVIFPVVGPIFVGLVGV
jgi:hypothetical protein